jgi:predicted acetyltransferase
MSNPKPILIEPTEELVSEFLMMAKEYQAAGDPSYAAALEDFSSYFSTLLRYARGINLPLGHVPSSRFWLVSGQHVIGQSSLRHHLNPSLEREGGHIGYNIRPSERRKGFGTMILSLTLEKAKGIGLTRVFVTCDTDNVASARIIEKNGGRLQGQVISERSGKLINQYWIEP